MLTNKEIKLTSKRNYQRMRELIRISYGIGVNVEAPTRLRESLKIISATLIIFSCMDIYGQWNYIMRYVNNIPKVAESICLAFQTIISMIKLLYFLFTERKFAKLMHIAKSHELIHKIEIFHEDFPNKAQLRKEINKIMEKNWKATRFQLIFYLCSCAAIVSNYFLHAMVMNLYNYIQGTPDYEPMYVFPAIYPMWESKGMAFPYHPLLTLIGASAAYLSAMGAVNFLGVFVVLCLHGVSLVQVFKVMVQQSTSPILPRRLRVRYLRYCIYHYQRVYSYVQELRQLFKHIIILQFLISLVVLGIVLFQASVGLESDFLTLLRMMTYISGAGYEVFTFCFNGQLLTNALDELPLAIYSCEWYDESKEFKQLLQMMIMRTNREFSLEISWFATMSLPTFVALIKTSGSYFLLLRNLYE